MSALVELRAPPEVLTALQDGRTYSTGWIRTWCPYCDPGRSKDRSLAAHPARHFGRNRDRGGWKCHRCEAEKRMREAPVVVGQFAYDPNKARAEEKRRRERALQMIERSSAIQPGDPVDRYLRGRQLTPLGPTWPHALRRARLRHPHARREFYAMLSVVTNVANVACGVHRTFLTEDGRKADVDPVKMTFGPIGGGAVRLGIDSETIIVAEGIESAIGAAMQLDVDAVPWAAMSTGNMQRLDIPRDVHRVIIAPDNDRKNRFGKKPGREAATALRSRIEDLQITQDRRIRVQISPPPRGRRDFADFG